MPLKIIFLITNEYRECINKKGIAERIHDELGKYGISMEWKDMSKSVEDKTICGHAYENGELYLSDDKQVLQMLASRGCFTIAVYHEGVSGILSGTKYAIEGVEDLDAEYLNKVYQRYRKIPWAITETERCKIREMGPEDTDDLYELYADREITKYTEGLFSDREKEKQYILDYSDNIYHYYGFGTWLIHRKEDGRLIGRAGFNYRPGFDEVELGFVIGRPYWRMGYAFEVCRHLLWLGKTVFEFDKVQALADKRNVASVRLLEKLGFIYKEEVMIDGRELGRYLYETTNLQSLC